MLDDDVTPQDNNTGIMQALWEAGGVQAIFVGHDHGINRCKGNSRNCNKKIVYRKFMVLLLWSNSSVLQSSYWIRCVRRI